MTSVLITGANRGLGLGLLRKILEHKDPPALVIATYRNAATSKELLSLASTYPSLKLLQLEVSDVSSFPKFVEQVSAIVGSNGLNVLVNNAGMAAYKDTLEAITDEDYLNIYKTNVIGPVFLTKALLPLIKKAAEENSGKPMGMRRGAVLNISSLLGSVSLNTVGSHYGYRESKAALNTFTRSIAVEFKDTGILFLTIHPGWVQTDLGGPSAPLTVDQTMGGLCEVLYNLNEAQQGQFVQWNGDIMPW